MQLLFFDEQTEDLDEAGNAESQSLMLNFSKAAEHLVAADILQRNWPCSIVGEGLRYDLIAEIGGPRRIQVKMRQRPQHRGTWKPFYTFGQGPTGSFQADGKRRRRSCLNDYSSSIDLFAFVAFDRRRMIYVLPDNIHTMRLQFSVADFTEEKTNLSWSEAMRSWGVE